MVQVIRHVPYIFYGHFASWIKTWGAQVIETKFFQASPHPSTIDRCDLIVVLGGPMSVNDSSTTCPWLIEEMKYLEKAMAKNKKILGICLGAQLIARVLGAKVSKMKESEIGWYPVFSTEKQIESPILKGFPSQWMTFHWHEDQFETPAGCQNLFFSEACQEQAFIYNQKVVGLQFHPEMDRPGVQNLLWRLSKPLDSQQRWVQSSDEINQGFLHSCKNEALLHQIIDRLLAV